MLLKASYLFELFSVGLKVKTTDSLPTINQLLKSNYKRFIYQQSDRDTFIIFEDSMNERQKILKNAQNGWVSKSEIEYSQMKKKYIDKHFNTAINLMMISQDEPLVAFIEYQKGNYAIASMSLNKAIGADYKLEKDFNFPEIVFHRIHLMHNNAKVMMKQEEKKLAMQYLSKLLYALAFYQESTFKQPLTLPQNQEYTGYYSVLFQNICDSLSILLSGAEEEIIEYLNPLPMVPEVSQKLDRCYYNLVSLCKNPEIFNKSLEEILGTGRIPYGGFWYAAVALLHKWCEENEPHFAKKLIEQLQLEKCPPYWLQFVKSRYK